MRPNLFLKQVC